MKTFALSWLLSQREREVYYAISDADTKLNPLWLVSIGRYCGVDTAVSRISLLVDHPRDLKDKTMGDKLMYILNVNTQNYPFFTLQLVVETFGHST